MLIEEFMVLANEEVAKWCEKMELPFLSRVHGLPSTEQMQTIIRIIELKEFKKQPEPVHIRQFMDGLESTEEYFRVSRLLLPKMAKATYSDKKFRHFGLALEYYTHFTSPIRRYPDLQVHRIIKEFLHKELNDSRKIHYQKLLTKVAKKTSENERHAEEIERAFDSLFMCRYMQQFV
jgi:ribonuclease R